MASILLNTLEPKGWEAGRLKYGSFLLGFSPLARLYMLDDYRTLNSNPRSQRSSEGTRFIHLTARPSWSSPVVTYQSETQIYCDVPPENRDIGVRVYDRFLDKGLAKRLHNRIAPVSIQRKHLYNNRGMLLRYNALVRSVSVTKELLYNVFQIQERRHLVQKSVLR
jgi:hypothetical protein